MSDRLKLVFEEASKLPELQQDALARLIEGALSRHLDTGPATLGELMDGGFQLPTIEGKPRADGKPWSEVEAAHDAA